MAAVRAEHGRMLAVLPSHVAGWMLYLLLLRCRVRGWYKNLKYSATICILSLFPSHALVASWCLGSSRGLGHPPSGGELEREGEMVNHLAFGWKPTDFGELTCWYIE